MDACPNLGELISLYTCAPSRPREDFVDAYLDESSLRNVMFLQKDSAPLISEPVFHATKVSRHILLFHLKILNEVDVEGESGFDASHLNRLQEAWRSVRDQVEAGGWGVYLRETGCSEKVRSGILADTNSWIAECIARAAANVHK
eukprot:4890991-Ditylum_brightwellii.AAC.1